MEREYAVTEPLKLPHESQIIWEAMSIFEQHGCTIKRRTTHVEMSVPAGTTRQEILPRMLEERYWLAYLPRWVESERESEA